MIVSVKMLAALLMMLIGYGFSELIRLEIRTWKIAHWLEKGELIES